MLRRVALDPKDQVVSPRRQLLRAQVKDLAAAVKPEVAVRVGAAGILHLAAGV